MAANQVKPPQKHRTRRTDNNRVQCQAERKGNNPGPCKQDAQPVRCGSQ